MQFRASIRAPAVGNIEYKRGRDANVINQGLFYLSWLTDHRAEFDHLVRRRFGSARAAQVLWSAPRLICVAEDFTRYDLHAVHEIQRSIDLVAYRFFGEDLLTLETVASVQPKRAARGADAPDRRSIGAWTNPRGAEGLPELRRLLDEVLLGLGEDVQTVERKQYVAYRRLRNFACVGNSQQRQILVYLKADPREIDLISGFTRDVSEIGHHGSGSLEVRLHAERDLERAVDLFRRSYAAA